MAALEIHRFTPDDTEDVRTSFEIINAIGAADAPWEHPWLLDRFEGFLRKGWDGEPPVCYLATVDGKAVGQAFVFYSERDNTHLGWAWMGVLPEHRRLGYGSALFAHVQDEVRAAGRTSIGADGWESERAVGFAAKHGLEKRSQAIMRRQTLSEIPKGRLQELYDEAAARATDYELVRIVGRTPDDMVDAMVELVAAINDAPTDDLDIEDEVFSAERLAAYETSQIERGSRLYRLVARHRATGELGGHTVIAVEYAASGDRRPARHGRRRCPPRASAGPAAQGRDAAVAGGGGAAARERGHLERRVERPHDRGQRGARLPDHGPRAAVPEVALSRPQSRAVSTSGPSSVIAMVCSMCAPREPSPLRSVQPSRSV